MSDTTVSSLPCPDAILVLTPHDLSVSGGAVARDGGMTVFLDKGLPGETVRARVTERKKRFLKADVVETLTQSPHAVAPHCPETACGGCAWTTFSYEAETAWKEKHVRETLRRIGKVTFEGDAPSPAGSDAPATYRSIIPSPRALGYRNKLELAFGTAIHGPDIGLKERGTHMIVPVRDCPLFATPLADILTTVRAWMQEQNLSISMNGRGFLRYLVVRRPEYAPEGTPQCVAELITAPGSAREHAAVASLGAALMAGGLSGFAHSVRKAASDVAYGEKTILTLGETVIHEKIGDVLIQAPLQAFLQVNTLAAERLYGVVRDLALALPIQSVWDLYCGVGGIALTLATPQRTIRGFESVPEAVRFAKKNAASVPCDLSFTQGDVAALLKAETAAPDLVVLDPPRAGMEEPLVASLLRLAPRYILSISCDAATQARDIARLSPVYRLATAGAVDLFPHTPHVESYALLCNRQTTRP